MVAPERPSPRVTFSTLDQESDTEGRLRWLTPEEATRLLDACRESRNADLTDLVEFALFTGMRRGEVLGLAWERVDRARGVVLLDVTKSGRRREVPLNGRADAVLARRGSKSAGLVFGTQRWDHFRTAWDLAVGRAKLIDFHFHDLRHTFASWAVQRGATLQEVSAGAGLSCGEQRASVDGTEVVGVLRAVRQADQEAAAGPSAGWPTRCSP